MVYVNQLRLEKYGIDRNKRFLRQMYSLDGMSKSFEMLDAFVSCKR